MTPERHEQVKRIFLAACDLPPGQAAALLDQECAGDPELRNEVESLLVHHFSRTIIQTPNENPSVASASFENTSGKVERFPPGTVLAGRYRILAPLGTRRHGRRVSGRRPETGSAGRTEIPRRVPRRRLGLAPPL